MITFYIAETDKETYYSYRRDCAFSRFQYTESRKGELCTVAIDKEAFFDATGKEWDDSMMEDRSGQDYSSEDWAEVYTESICV